jgi:hypothetical protein
MITLSPGLQSAGVATLYLSEVCMATSRRMIPSVITLSTS